MTESLERQHRLEPPKRLNKVPIPMRERMRDLRTRALPLLVWLAGVAGVYVLWMAEPVAPSYYGLALTARVEISSPVAGQLAEVLVELHEDIAPGQLIAALDQTLHQAALETANAELARLTAEVDAEQARLLAVLAAEKDRQGVRRDERLAESALDRPTRMRRFLADESDLEVRALQTELKIAFNKLQADRIEVRLKRAESLVSDAAGPAADVEDLRLERAQVLESVKRNAAVLAQLHTELSDAVQRRHEFEALMLEIPKPATADANLDLRLSGLRAAIVVQRRGLQELELQREHLLLRATHAGRVAAIPAQPGQALLAGEAVAVLVDPHPEQVLLYVPEATATTVALGEKFRVARVNLAAAGRQTDAAEASPTQAVEAWVVSAAPAIEELPARLWRDPRYPEFGRAYLLGPVSELGLVPGERVTIDPARYNPRPVGR